MVCANRYSSYVASVKQHFIFLVANIVAQASLSYNKYTQWQGLEHHAVIP